MNKEAEVIQATVVAIGRHRLVTDGQGITSLVCFQGCPLQCKYCINSHAISSENKNVVSMTPQTLYEKVKIDELYFLATGGGVTFGGGEPLLYPEFIKEFRRICGDSWHLCAETSLAVPWENVKMAADVIDVFIFDCKDVNPDVYEKYTGKDNRLVLDNVRKLSQYIPSERIIVKVPLIPNFNTEEHRKESVAFFKEMGLNNFDLFTYLENK